MNFGSIMEREEKRFVYRIRYFLDENNEEEGIEEGISVSWVSECRWLWLEVPFRFFDGSSIWRDYLKFQSVQMKENEKKLRNVGWKISVGAISRPMLATEFSIQSLNEICMISIRKCLIGVIRWCFFFKPRSVIFPDQHRLAFISISISESNFFFRGVLMFCLPSKWKHAGVGGNKTSVDLERKILTDLHCKFLPQHRTKKHPLS